VSPDTSVIVLDSVRSFPRARRRSGINNRADQFRVRASELAQAGDTVPLRLEVTFTDAGNTIVMPVAFEVVLGGDVVGVRQGDISQLGPAGSNATVIGRVLFLPGGASTFGALSVLRDASGRKVLDLAPGPNDVRRVAPGVYFVSSPGVPGAARVVILN